MAGRLGRSGRRPEPTAVKRARGTYRTDRDGQGVEIDAPDEGLEWEPDTRWLPEVQDEHTRLVALLLEHHVLCEADRMAWYAGMSQANRLMKLEDKLTNVDFLATSKESGTEYMHPGFAVLKMFQTTFQKFCQEFGLTPSSRAALKFDFAPKKKDALSQMLLNNEAGNQDGFSYPTESEGMGEPPAHQTDPPLHG